METKIRAEPVNVNEELDAIIKAMEQCTEDCRCEGCAYHGRMSCWQELMEDAVMLLKKKRPRVMSNAEAGNLKAGERVCFEWRMTGRMDLLTVKETDRNTVTFERNSYDMRAKMSDYGADWRCWTELPDGETQKNCPWTEREEQS